MQTFLRLQRSNTSKLGHVPDLQSRALHTQVVTAAITTQTQQSRGNVPLGTHLDDLITACGEEMLSMRVKSPNGLCMPPVVLHDNWQERRKKEPHLVAQFPTSNADIEVGQGGGER